MRQQEGRHKKKIAYSENCVIRCVMADSSPIPVRLTNTTIKRLDAVARQIGSNRAAVMRMLVEKWLDHYDAEGKATLPPDWKQVMRALDGRCKPMEATPASAKAPVKAAAPVKPAAPVAAPKKKVAPKKAAPAAAPKKSVAPVAAKKAAPAAAPKKAAAPAPKAKKAAKKKR